MRLAPRSLFGRSVLLIVALIVLGQLVGMLLVRELILRPRLTQIADGLARNVSAIRSGLVALPPEQRRTFVDQFNLHVMEGVPAGAVADGPPMLMPMELSVVRTVSERIAAENAEIVWRREAGGSLGLRLTLDGVDYWIVLPSLPPAHELTDAWLAASLASALLALLGAYLIQRHLNQPLARVVAAVQTLAGGGSPELLPEQGPVETATLSRNFNQLALSLAQADRERALMLAGVSHDLRTPMAKLRLGIEILRGGAEPALITSMTRSVEEMDAIVGQFLDFARGQDAEPCISARLDDLARELADVYADHGKPLALVLGSPPPVQMQPTAMRRAVTNLIENAWRHGRPPVSLSTGSEPGQVWIEVADGGDGIDPADEALLRQPFQRAAAARDGPSGAGLGLAIVDRIARWHGGGLALLPREGGGLRARIGLPRRA